jgi:hypothetical protein
VDEHVDDVAEVCQPHGNEPTLVLVVVECPGLDPGNVGLNEFLEDENVTDEVEVGDLRCEQRVVMIGKIAEEGLVPGALL